MYDELEDVGGVWILWDDWEKGTVMHFTEKNNRIDQCFQQWNEMKKILTNDTI